MWCSPSVSSVAQHTQVFRTSSSSCDSILTSTLLQLLWIRICRYFRQLLAGDDFIFWNYLDSSSSWCPVWHDEISTDPKTMFSLTYRNSTWPRISEKLITSQLLVLELTLFVMKWNGATCLAKGSWNLPADKKYIVKWQWKKRCGQY